MDPTYKGLPTPLPTIQKQSGPNLRLILIIAGVFLLLITVLGLVFGGGSGSTNDRQRLLYRLDAVLTLTNSAKSSIKDDGLQKINAEVNLILSGDQTAIKAVIPAAKASKELAAIKTAETDAETTTELKAAAANGTYDTTYRTVLEDKLNATSLLVTSIAKSTTGTKTKAALATLGEHLTTYINQLQTTN